MKRLSAILLTLFIYQLGCFSQQGPAFPVTVRPVAPVAGEDILVIVEMPGASSESIEFPEPVFGEGLRFLGLDILPTDSAAGTGSVVSLRFAATKAGTWSIGKLEPKVDGKTISLESLMVEVKDPPGKAKSVLDGEWIAPRSVWQFEQFSVTAVGRDGVAIDLPGVPGIEGASAELAADGKALLFSARDSFALPATKINYRGRTYALGARSVTVRKLPPAAGEVFGVGNFESSLEAEVASAEVGDFIPFFIRVQGQGTPVQAALPDIVLSRESSPGHRSPVGLEAVSKPLVVMTVQGRRWQCSVSARSGFYAAKEGVYRVSMGSRRYFDPASGQVVVTEKRELSITIKPRKKASLVLDPRIAARIESVLPSLARTDPAWQASTDFAVARKFSKALAAAPLKPDSFQRATRLEQEAFVALLLASGKSEEAIFLLLPAERGFWPWPEASRLLDAASESAGLPARPKPLLPAPGVFSVLGIAVAALLALALLRRVLARRRAPRQGDSRKPARSAALGLLALLLLCTIGGLLSAAERSRPMFVTAGCVVRVVPSETSTVSFAASPGFCGRVAWKASPWFFAEFPDGRSGWILEKDVIFY